MMSVFKINSLRHEAENEINSFIDKNLKPLPKNKDGSINKEARGFQHNDVDALRHAYVSGVYTMRYGERAARLLGNLQEYAPWAVIGSSRPNEGNARNMDLWNNSVGRKYGKESQTKEELFRKLLKALKNGELIIDLRDSRKYSSSQDSMNELKKDRVIVLQETEKGENVLFLDTQKLEIFSKEYFVSQIKSGAYGDDYEVRTANGKEFPASKRDGHSNLG